MASFRTGGMYESSDDNESRVSNGRSHDGMYDDHEEEEKEEKGEKFHKF